MDVIFEQQEGESFTIEVGFFDTVLEMKEKIEKYQNIPIPKQTLIFNGRILQDEQDVEFCQILQLSRVKLIVASSSSSSSSQDEFQIQNPDSSSNSNSNSNSHSNSNSNSNSNSHSHSNSNSNSNNNNNNNHNHVQNNVKIHLNINVNLPSNQSNFPIQIDPNDSIRSLKQRIHEIDAVGPLHRIILHSKTAELQDQRSLLECDLEDNSEVEVRLRQSPPPTTTATAKNKLKVMVKPKCGASKIAMEVNPTDNVRELKRELQKVQRILHFHLPAEGFFFIYDRDVMDEDRSFRWHGVSQGDTIEIFNGSVTGGS